MKKQVKLIAVLAILVSAALACIAAEQKTEQKQVVAKTDDTTASKSNPKITSMNKKLESIIIPKIDFNNVELPVAVKFLNAFAKENDAEKQGVNIVLMPGNSAPITISMEKVSLRIILKSVADMAGYRVEVGSESVVLRPKSVK